MALIDSNPNSLHLIFQDSDLLIINKPSGVLSITDGYDVSLLQIKDLIEPDYGKVWIVHRLDKDTSGIMLLARNAETHRVLNESFRSRTIEKLYHGLVTPAPDWREMDIQLPLQTDADRKHRTRANPIHGKTAHSICRVLKWFKLGALMEIEILTGISHQIRAHLRAYNLALLGDQLYQTGLPRQPFPVQRTMLHARCIGFTHPTTGQHLTFQAPYPDDFREAYERLKLTRVLETTI
jgi:tRNA pseudouridine32 synthase / 23S rRNA pseudouridine746 synthase